MLLGPPASGKGTQAELITGKYGLPVTSPGAILREEKRAGTELGIEAEKVTSQGRLLPDSMVVGLVERWLKAHNSAFIFDGFPRSVGQANALEEILAERRTPLEVVIALNADVPTLQARVAHRRMCTNCGYIVSIGLHVQHDEDPCPRCGGKLVRRSDDTPEVLAARLREYSEKTKPLLSYYEGKGLLRCVDSSAVPTIVFQSICAILDE